MPRTISRLLVAALLFGALEVVPGIASSAGGIRGRVTASPTCPVEREPPDPACAPRGFAATLRITRVSSGRVVARLISGDDGRFRARLVPGRYIVDARPAAGGKLPRCPAPVRATVRAGQYASVLIDCDSGIR